METKQQSASKAENSQKKLKWYKQPGIISIMIIFLFLLIVRSEGLFVLFILIFLVCFLLSWSSYRFFYSLFPDKSKTMIRSVFGLATVFFL